MYCTDNELLDNTIFTSHKVTNASTETLDSMYMGLWTDIDLGCYTDDFIGCIPTMNTFYGYNQDPQDGTTGCQCDQGVPTFCDDVPTQAITFLNKDMSSFMPLSFATCPSDPISAVQFYNILNGLYANGDPITIGGNGCQGTEPTKFPFPDNPNDSQGWSMFTASINIPFGDIRSLANTYVGSLPPGGSTTLEIGYSFHQDANLDHLEIVDEMYNQIPNLQLQYDNKFQNDCALDNCIEDCVWTGDANRDSIVTGFDWLHLGLGIDNQGDARNKPLIWYPFGATDWNASIDGINNKHADCNGDGQISEHDFDWINTMFDNSYKTIPTIDEYPHGDELSIIATGGLNMDPVNIGSFGTIQVHNNQMDSLYGLAFTLEYDTAFITYFSNHSSESVWDSLGTRMTKMKEDIGEFHYADVKTDHLNSVTKTGQIGRVILRVKPNNFEQVQTLIRIKNIKAILNDGTELDYGAKDYVLNIFNPDGTGILLNNEDFAIEKIEIFPNPTTHLLNVKFEQTTSAQFSIFDIYGKNVFQQKEETVKEATLPIEHLTSGIYFLKIKKEGKEITHKFIKI